jgi:rare lipoprotein A
MDFMIYGVNRRYNNEVNLMRNRKASTMRSVWFMAGVLAAAGLALTHCGAIKATYWLTKNTIVLAYKVTKFAGSTVYTVGGFTFDVVTAPFSWPLTHQELETIDGLSPKEAIAQGRVKASPYVVHGRRYVPMSVEKAKTYREKGVASWYGDETYRQHGGHMTANGEAFNPDGLSAAHKRLPLPMFVRVTNLANRRSIIVRVNDRGPFVSGRIIDLSAGAAKRLGFFDQGTARVLVEAVELEG